MQDKFKALGLNSTESDIYISLVKNGKLTPSKISRITNINRTTVYASVYNLVKAGLVTEDFTSKTKYFIAKEPSSLLDILSDEESALRKKSEVVVSLIKELNSLPKSKNYSIPKIEIIEGDEIEKFLYRQTEVWEKSMSELKQKTWWGFQDHKLVGTDYFKKWILWYWNRAPKDFDLKMFTNESEVESELKQKNITQRALRFWSGDTLTSTQWVLGEYIVSIVVNEDLTYLIQMRDAVISDNMRKMFKNMWGEK